VQESALFPCYLRRFENGEIELCGVFFAVAICTFLQGFMRDRGGFRMVFCGQFVVVICKFVVFKWSLFDVEKYAILFGFIFWGFPFWELLGGAGIWMN
jgi:hypothetical protein